MCVLSRQEAVAKLCMDYWTARAPSRVNMCVQLVPYMLWKAISGRAADVKRCHALRDALPEFDLDNEVSGDLVELLLRAAMSPVFLRCAEGRRLLAMLFDLSDGLTEQLITVVKSQVAQSNTRPSVLDAYGALLLLYVCFWPLVRGVVSQ